jgi:hypothetical protein
MTLSKYIKNQLDDFVECYENYFRNTFGIAIAGTFICFLISIFLLHFTKFWPSSSSREINLLSFFFHRYSMHDTYSLVDLTKTVFIFIVSIYSVGLLRLARGEDGLRDFNAKSFINSITNKDLALLVLALFLASIFDFLLFETEGKLISGTESKNVRAFINETIFHIRIYLPLILFAFVIEAISSKEKRKITLRRMLFLYISLWLFNEFAFEFSSWLRSHLFGLILMPFASPAKYFLFESILGIPTIAFFFAGYFSALTKSLELTRCKG